MEVGQGEWTSRCENLLSWKLLSTQVDPLEKRAGVKILETKNPGSCGAQPHQGELVGHQYQLLQLGCSFACCNSVSILYPSWETAKLGWSLLNNTSTVESFAQLPTACDDSHHFQQHGLHFTLCKFPILSYMLSVRVFHYGFYCQVTTEFEHHFI